MKEYSWQKNRNIGIEQAIKELTLLYDDLTTSDLQGVAMAKAIDICYGKASMDVIENISDKILDGVYSNVGQVNII